MEANKKNVLDFADQEVTEQLNSNSDIKGVCQVFWQTLFYIIKQRQVGTLDIWKPEKPFLETYE